MQSEGEEGKKELRFFERTSCSFFERGLSVLRREGGEGLCVVG